MSPDQRWEVVAQALVEAELDKRIAKGAIIGDENRLAVYIRSDIEAQAERRPAWRQQQVDKHFGVIRRQLSKPQCPHCEVVFNASDEQAVRGDDGMTYCRVACARREPFTSLKRAIVAHPEWADQMRFIADILRRKGLEGGEIGLSSIHPPTEPAGADLDF